MVLLTQGSYQPRLSSGKLVPHQEKFANTSVWYDTAFCKTCGIEMNWNCIKWSAVCCLFLKCRKFKFNCTAVPSWSPDNSKCISFLWFSLQIQFPSFPRSNFTPCIPFPAKAAPCCQNWLFSVLWDKFHHQITLSNKSLQTIKCRPVSESSSPLLLS